MRHVSIDEILATMQEKGFAVDDRELALNLFGVRSENRVAGSYDDWIGALRVVDGSWELTLWEATVDPSPRYMVNPINRSGAAILVPGQYMDVYSVDTHNGWCQTLCQRKGKVRVYRDSDRDKNLEMYSNSVQSGMFGINFHWNKSGPSGNSDYHWTGSAGCQVFRRKVDHEEFMKYVYTHNGLYENTHTYTLLIERELSKSIPTESESKFESWAKWIDPEGKHDGLEGRLRKAYRAVAKWHPDEQARLYLMYLAVTQSIGVSAGLLQKVLHEMGLYKGKLDAKVGPKTKAAAKKLNGEEIVLRIYTSHSHWLRASLSDEEWANQQGISIDCFRKVLGLV